MGAQSCYPAVQRMGAYGMDGQWLVQIGIGCCQRVLGRGQQMVQGATWKDVMNADAGGHRAGKHSLLRVSNFGFWIAVAAGEVTGEFHQVLHRVRARVSARVRVGGWSH